MLTSQKVIELAGEAANGAIAHVGLTADAPQAGVKKFDAAFQKEFKTRSDHNGLKGYIGMYTVKAVTEKMGKFDSKAFAAAMKNISLLAKAHPGLLLDVSYDENGDLDRESYLTTVVKAVHGVVTGDYVGTVRVVDDDPTAEVGVVRGEGRRRQGAVHGVLHEVVDPGVQQLRARREEAG